MIRTVDRVSTKFPHQCLQTGYDQNCGQSKYKVSSSMRTDWLADNKSLMQTVNLHTSVLCKPSPRETNCTDPECCVCASDGNKGLECRKTSRWGIGYEIQCLECDENGKKSLYHGETSRTHYTRIKENLHQSRVTCNENKPLLKHSIIHHPGKQVKFKIAKTGSFQDPLSRQINEGVRINNSTSDPGFLINSKAEFHQGQVPRVMITSGLH